MNILVDIEWEFKRRAQELEEDYTLPSKIDMNLLKVLKVRTSRITADAPNKFVIHFSYNGEQNIGSGFSEEECVCNGIVELIRML